MPAQELSCAICGEGFMFTEEEQAFYESKGFQPPRKCKPCREAAKQSRGGGGGYGGSRGGYGGGGGGGSYGGARPPRQMYDAVCSACGIQTQVPFQPNGSKPVYCRECFQNASSSYSY
jgi:CxxC-x17-CxxC domain-containing protein